jgi:hypothetical protein
MNSFGERRGETAHGSTRVTKTQQPPDPKTEYDTVNELISVLETLDSVMNTLLGD